MSEIVAAAACGVCLLNKTEQARYPNLDAGGLTFKKVEREEKRAEQGELKL